MLAWDKRFQTLAGWPMRRNVKFRLLAKGLMELSEIGAGVGRMNETTAVYIHAVEQIVTPETFPLPENAAYYWEEKYDGVFDIIVYIIFF